jgi:hypothetical protein
MYAIPAETASQNMPFKKEDLPGPGKSMLSGRHVMPLSLIFACAYTSADCPDMS